MKRRCFLLDGRFLTSLASGVDRYAFETVKELDKVCGKQDVRILVPGSVRYMKPDAAAVLDAFTNIRVIYAGIEKLWTQGVFALYARMLNAVPVNLCNEVSLLAPCGIVCLHDTCYADNPQFFPPDEAAWFNKIYARIAKKAKVILTVSQFSAGRIEKVLNVPAHKIIVAGNGWQHFDRIEPNEYIFDKLRNVQKGQYFFTLSSANKNKNVDWVIRASLANPNEEFVLAGRGLDRVVDFNKYSNLHYAGAVTDEEAKALMKYCKAFIFPSYYEGFGIPPLEALSTGAAIIISDTSCLPEIFEDCAHYIQPDNPVVHFESLLKEETAPAKKVLDKYNWEKTAATLLRVFNEFE